APGVSRIWIVIERRSSWRKRRWALPKPRCHQRRRRRNWFRPFFAPGATTPDRCFTDLFGLVPWLASLVVTAPPRQSSKSPDASAWFTSMGRLSRADAGKFRTEHSPPGGE